MIRYATAGFRTAMSQYAALVLLSLYQAAWGLILIKLVKSAVLPLMRRYPGQHLDGTAVHIFWAESQFRLLKTDISHPYLWALAAILAARMVLTPFLNAGVYYSIHNGHLHSGYRFLKGIRELGKPFLMVYVLEMALMIAPLYALYRVAAKLWVTLDSYESFGSALLPWLAGYALYAFALHLAFMYIRFGITLRTKWYRSLAIYFRRWPGVMLLASAMLLVSLATAAFSLTVSLFWAGILAIALRQLQFVGSTLFKLWFVSAQYHLFRNG